MNTTVYRFSLRGHVCGLFLILITILFPMSAHAGKMTKHHIRSAVQTWVRHVTADAKPNAVINNMEPYVVDGETLAYIAHIEGGGYCLTGTSNMVLPVYYYSPGGSYDRTNPGNRVILHEIVNRTKRLKRRQSGKGRPFSLKTRKALDKRALYWQNLITASSASSAAKDITATGTTVTAADAAVSEPISMELDLTSQWNQISPYNNACPLFPPWGTDRTLTGCVATATAQIMYYWKWPDTGVGSGSVDYDFRWRTAWDEKPLANDPNIPVNWGGGGLLEWTSADGGKLRMNGEWDPSIFTAAFNLNNDASYRNALAVLWDRLTRGATPNVADFSTTIYNWGLMQDTHSDPADTGDLETAQLIHHVGIALEMSWGIWSSAASEAHIPSALADHFRYDPDAVYEITGSGTISKMTEEIQWLRPLVLRGCTTGGGCHAWVVYGYNKGTDPAREFKMNFGWGGDDDGWYSIDNIDMNGDNVPELNINQYHATKIAPLTVVGFVGNTLSGDGSPDNPYQNIEEAVAEAPDGATLIFKAGSINNFSGDSLVIDKKVTLKGKNAVIDSI